MAKQLIKSFKIYLLLMTIFLIGPVVAPSPASAWTSADLSSVDVTVELAEQGLSKVITQARFVVAGGQFHGFDLAAMPGGELIKEECRAALDNGRSYLLSFRKLRNGQTRIVLADKEEIKRGAVTFTLIHSIDFAAQGALRWCEGRARFSWTPLIWDEGLHVMDLHLKLPGKSRDAPVSVDQAVSRDYEVAIGPKSVDLTKFRPVRWYPMQVMVDFDPKLIPSLVALKEEEKPFTITSASMARSRLKPPTPLHILLLPAAVVLLGLITLIIKAFQVHKVFGHMGRNARFCLLTSTSLPLRFSLSLGACCLGLSAQYIGSVTAGVPALAAAAALWITRREQSRLRGRPGGEWKQIKDEDVAVYRRLAGIYHRSRMSLVDITTPWGIISFVLVLAAIGYVALLARVGWSRIGWTVVIDGLILIIPAWFSNVRAELPVDPTFEGFSILRRWRRSLSRLVGTVKTGATTQFWVREDDQGPIEVRLRVEPPPDGLNGIEVAGEVLQTGSMSRSCTAAILRMEPGSELARRLAACPHAAEHHLTPDLEEEIIVLRNRRGWISGLAPLRAALAMLPDSAA